MSRIHLQSNILLTLVLSVSPACSRQVDEYKINQHLDNDCREDQGTPSNPGRHTHNATSSNFRLDGEKPLASIFSQKPKQISDPSTSKTWEGSLSSTKKRKVDLTPSTDDVPRKRGKTATVQANLKSAAPLAERLRPSNLEEFVGQQHILGPGSLLNNMLNMGSTGSMVFWGPPG